MIIYRIYNKINGKSYIGQTVHKTFNSRYSGGKWWDNTDNPALINAYKKYGPNSFEIIILEQNLESIDKLNELEIFYADKFNTYSPNGYNLRGCGNNRRLLPYQIELIKNVKSKTYFLRKIDTWEIIEINNLNEFCRKNNLDNASLRNMIKKTDGVIVSQGYCLPSTTKQEVDEKDVRKFKNKIFELIDENGQIHRITYLKEFMRQHNLEKGCTYKLLNGQMLYYKGFRLPNRVKEQPRGHSNFEIMSPEGKLYKGTNITAFCEEQNLKYHGILKVINKQTLEYQGWKLPETTTEMLLLKGRKNKYSTILISPQDEEFIVDNLYLFCIKKNLNYNNIYSLYKGLTKTCRGWYIKGSKPSYKRILISPLNKFIEIRNLKQFCIDNKLNYSCMSNMISGNALSYKGWKLAT